MVLLRRLLGDVLRRHRIRQSRTLRDVSSAAGVSLGYLSEVERGRKEASSELLAAICGALDVSLSEVLHEVSDDLAREERRIRLAPVGFGSTASPRVQVPMPGRPMPVRPVAGIPPHHPARPLPKPEPVSPVATLAIPAPFGAVVAA